MQNNMVGKQLVLAFLIVCTGMFANAQKIVYSIPDKEDSRRMEFEIAGKIGNNFLLYKNTRNRFWISVLNNDMEQIAKVEQDYVPYNDRMINVDFFPYTDFCYMIYQYQKKNIIYCVAAKIGSDGKKIGSVIEIDTTHLGFAANNKIYTVQSSEDKSKLIVFKINSKNKRLFVLSSMLMNEKLELLKKSQIGIPMDERNDFINNFYLDNDGDMVFSKVFRNNNDNISKAAIIVKYAQADTLQINDLKFDKTWLDEIHIKVDNFNKRYYLTSFYLRERRGNIEGLYFYVWDKTTGRSDFESTSTFTEELRKEAKGESSIKTAFNDHFILNIITRKDGGFIIGSEAYYTTSRFNNWNRWDYLYGSPYLSSFNNSNYYSPYYSNTFSGSRTYNSQAVRYHADNIAVLSFDNKGILEWSNVMAKTQFNDESDDLLSYQVMKTGGQLHFLFNENERKNNLLTDYSISPDGQITRSPTLKNLDKGYDFMPKYGKQVSSRQMIVPCIYRNYICFAKIDFSQN